jgi:hypothetical protein
MRDLDVASKHAPDPDPNSVEPANQYPSMAMDLEYFDNPFRLIQAGRFSLSALGRRCRAIPLGRIRVPWRVRRHRIRLDRAAATPTLTPILDNP